jgi:hypothetical protein
MSNIIYSREYLRGIPEQLKQQRKKQLIDSLFSQVCNHVLAAASNEKTSHMLEEHVYAQNLAGRAVELYRNNKLTDEEILSALSEKFPDCVVSFQENWVDTSHNTRVLKKGILIDWS